MYDEILVLIMEYRAVLLTVYLIGNDKPKELHPSFIN